MVKVHSGRFYLCLEKFNMLTVEGCFETAMNSEWRDHEDSTSVWNRLTCWLSKDVLRRR